MLFKDNNTFKKYINIVTILWTINRQFDAMEKNKKAVNKTK